MSGRVVSLGFAAITVPLRVLIWLPIIGRVLNVWLAIMAAASRLGAGALVASGLAECRRPKKTLILYEFEGCPFCRKVREAMTALDLDFMVYPCPRVSFEKKRIVEGSRYRPEVVRMGGRAQFPYLVDENTNTRMYDSDAIVAYLWSTYGGKATPSLLDRVANSGPWQSVGLVLASAARAWDPCRLGIAKTSSRLPPEALELWGYETSPFTKIAREALCSLELPYKLVNVGHGSTVKRALFKERFGEHLSMGRKAAGLVMLPLLVDPNTNTIMVESGEIVQYLFETYHVEDQGAANTSRKKLA